MKSSPEGDFYCKLACFRELVFMSFCAVALKVTDNAASVYKVMREYSGSEAQEKHLVKLTRGAIWANRSIFALSGTQWGSDCSDVFLLAGQPVSFYARYAEYSESLPHFLHQMEKKAGDQAILAKELRSMSLAVPLIIEKLARGSLSLSKICETLGYELRYMEDCRLPFHQALSFSSTRKRCLGSAQSNPSMRPCVSQSQSTSSYLTPNHNTESVGEQVENEINAQSISESTFSPTVGSGTEVRAGPCQSDVTSHVGFSLELSNGPLLQGQSPQQPRLPAEELSLGITQLQPVPDRDSSTQLPIFDLPVPHNSQPSASYPEAYSILDWEKDFLLLDWERDYGYTSFHSGNWQD